MRKIFQFVFPNTNIETQQQLRLILCWVSSKKYTWVLVRPLSACPPINRLLPKLLQETKSETLTLMKKVIFLTNKQKVVWTKSINHYKERPVEVMPQKHIDCSSRGRLPLSSHHQLCTRSVWKFLLLWGFRSFNFMRSQKP